MPQTRGTSDRSRLVAVVAAALCAAVAAACSRDRGTPAASSASITLRIGIGQVLATSQIAGFRQLVNILTTESLARVGEDGRMQPSLAESWTLDDSGRSLKVKLRAGVKFNDGTPLDAAIAAQALTPAIRDLIGPLFEDVESIAPSSTNEIEIRFRRPSVLHLEALEAAITKPGSPTVGTGAFMLVPNTTEFRAFSDHYLGKPAIDRVVVSSYPSVRAAWAEALRGNLDVLYEVSGDAIDSLEHSTTISTHVFTRRYQHVVILNSKTTSLHSPETRRALNSAIDRDAFVRGALNGHGVPSNGPIWPHYWALPPSATAGKPDATIRSAASKITFTCLVVPDAVDERIALEIKRQFAAAGIDMAVESVSQQQIHERMAKGKYDAALLELISGPTFLRPLTVWLSNGPINVGQFGNATVDVALARARNAQTEDEFRKAVADVQQAFQDDPPAVFLAWNQRARAVSNKFIVSAPESGRDILSTLRMWKPAADAGHTSRN